MNFFKRLKDLSHHARLTIYLNTVFAFSRAIGDVFFNVYLWRSTNSLIPIAKYQFFYWFSLVVGFVFIGYKFKGKGMSQLFRISFFLHFIFYIAILLLREQASDFVIWLGIAGGFAASFYWAAHQVMVYSGTDDKVREMFYGVLGSLGSFANIVGPAVAGAVIWFGARFDGEKLTGYYLLFGLLALVFLISEFAIKQTGDVTFKRFRLVDSLFLFKEKPVWRLNLLRSFVDGMMITRAFLWSVLSFVILKNELRLGAVISIFAALSIVTNPLIGLLYKTSRRKLFNSIGMIFLVFAGIVYPLWLNPVSLIIDRILGESIGWPLFVFAWLAFFFLAIDKDPEGKERQFEYFTSHEIFQGVGRLLSIGLFMLFFNETQQITQARFWFGGLSLLFIVVWWLVGKIRVQLVTQGYNEGV